MAAQSGKISKNDNRKRFSREQNRFLEYMFETEAKPELTMKQELAEKTGLHPHQVAIWFQNKRARTKSRQMEHDYNILKINYDKLASMTESLRRANQSLTHQLQILKDLAEKHQGGRTSKSNNTPKTSRGTYYSSVPSYEDNKASVSGFEEESKALNIAEEPHCTNQLTGNRCTFEYSSPLEIWSCCSNWWEE